jgi:trehalose 6-phosphate synthase/phosphatase
MQQLSTTKDHRLSHKLNLLTPTTVDRTIAKYRLAKKRLILLDYDGVLSPLIPDPSPAASAPTPELLASLKALCAAPGNEVMVVSGRPKEALESWFGDLPISLGAEHGGWTRHHGHWSIQYDIPADWKKPFLPIIESTTRLTPGSHIENKHFSLVWHYRNVAPELAFPREVDLKRALDKLAANSEIGVFQGHKIIEVKPRLITKKTIAGHKLAENTYDFIMAVGDDYNDEDMFTALPSTALSIKVGLTSSNAEYHIESVDRVKALLTKLAHAAG